MARTNNKDAHRGVVIYLDGKEVANNAKAIRAEMKKVRSEIDSMTIGTKEYEAATRRYKQLNGILEEHKRGLRDIGVQTEKNAKAQESLFAKGKRWLKDYSVAIITTFEALTGVAMQLNKFRKMAAEQEDAAANLKALTGLDDDNIAWLKQQAETLSTTMEASGLRVRKSVTEILEAYMLVGSKKPELLKDKEALNAVTIEAMRLAEAANMELKDAVAAVTLAMNQYGDSAEEAARYVNVLAAGSKFGAVGVATQTESLVKAGVAANMANVPIEQLVGVLETLGERGIEGQIAGTQLKTFFLKLEAGAEDTRPSVVGLQQALETLAAKNLSVTELTKMFGLESISTAKALISSADKVKYYTDAVTGTNTAVEQAAINSDTTAARMAQVRNQINLTGQELAKTLAPILNKTVGWTRKFVMILPGLIDWLKKWGLEVVVLTAAYATYTLGARAAEAVTRAWHTTQLLVTTTIGRLRAAVQLSTLAINFNSKAMIQLGLQMRSMNALSKLFVATQALVRAGFLALTGQATQAARAMGIVRMAISTINPWAAAATAIAAVGTALYVYYRRAHDAIHVNKQLQQAQDNAAERYEEQRAKIEYLNKVVHDETLGYQRRNDALAELKRLVPGYEASLTKEGKLINDNADAVKRYLEQLKKEIALKALQEQYVETLREQIRAQRKVDEYEKDAAKHYNARMDQQEGKNGSMGRFNPIKWIYDSAAEQYYDFKKGNAQKELDDARKDAEEIQHEIDNVTKQLDKLLSSTPEGSSGDEGGEGSGGGGSKDADRQKRIREAIEAVNTEYDARANELKRQYIDGSIATEEEYSRQLETLELERLNRQLEIAGLEPKQREQLQGKILDMKMKLIQQLRSLDDFEVDEEQAKLQKMLKQNEDAYNRRNVIIAKALAAGVLTEEEAEKRRAANKAQRRADDRKAEEQSAAQRLSISRKGLEMALLQLRKVKASEMLTEDDYNRRVSEARKAFFSQALKDQQLSKEDREKLVRELTELEVQQEEAKADKVKATYDKIQGYASQFGDAMEDLVSDLMKEEEDAWKNFGKNMLKAVVDALKKVMEAYMVQVTARNIAEKGLILGGIVSAAELAAIELAAGTLDGLISGFAAGGYTGQGRWDEPRGVVHAGEFVANRYAVANDAVRPVLDLIDQAQKNGSIANLTAEDIAAVARPSAPTSPASSLSGEARTRADYPPRDPELTAALHLLTRTTARAAEAYREPSPAYCYLEGRGGINTAQDMLSQIKNNASRKS